MTTLNSEHSSTNKMTLMSRVEVFHICLDYIVQLYTILLVYD